MMKRLFVAAMTAALSIAAASNALGQQLPAKPIRFVIGTPPGGALDSFGRLIAAKLQDRIKQQVIVENRVGASGMIAAQYVSRAPTDGTTLLFDTVGMTMNPAITQKLPYDPNALAPVARVITLPFVLVTNLKFPATNLAEAVTHLRASGSRINFAYAGTSTRLAGEQFRLTAGFTPTMVPYNGGAPTMTALMAGDTDIYMSDVPTAHPLITGGKLRALAVTSPMRSSVLPNTPTIKESGTDFTFISWYGFFAPAGTPTETLNLLNQELQDAAALPEVRERVQAIGADIAPRLNVQEFTQSYRSELERWKDLVKRAQLPLSE